jgi:hypothetical protein
MEEKPDHEMTDDELAVANFGRPQCPGEHGVNVRSVTRIRASVKSKAMTYADLPESGPTRAEQGIAGRYIDLDSTIGVRGPSLRTGAARIIGVLKMECEGGAIDEIWVEDSNGVLSSITPYDGLQLLPVDYTPELKEQG